MNNSYKNCLVISTRPSLSAKKQLNLFDREKIKYIHLPLLNIIPNLENLRFLEEIVFDYPYIFFVSPSAINLSANILDFKKIDASFITIGESSYKILRNYTNNSIFYSKNTNDSESLIKLDFWNKISHRKILIIRGENSREIIKKYLLKNNWDITEHIIYKLEENLTNNFINKKLFLQQLSGHKVMVIITSVMLAKLWLKFIRKFNSNDYEYLQNMYYISIHDRITKELCKNNINNIVTTSLNEFALLKVIKKIGENL